MMQRTRRPVHLLIGAGLVLAALAIAVLRAYPTDLEVYMTFGRRVLEGDDAIYAPDPGGRLPFTYPPFAAVCFALPAALPHWAQTALVHMLSVAALVRLCWLCVASARAESPWERPESPSRTPGRRRQTATWAVIALLAAMTLEPVLETFLFGQVNLLLAWLVAEDLLGRRSRWRGVGVGLAMGFKLTPGIFLVYLLLTRQWRAALVAAGTGAATGVVGFLILPASSWDFWTRAMLHSERVGGLAYSSNQSVNGALWRLLGEGGSPLAWAVLCGVLGLAFALGIIRTERAGLHLGAVSLAALLGLAVSPVSWSHHWVWVIAIVPALLAYGALSRWRGLAWGLAAAWLFACASWIIWWAPNEQDREYLQPLAVKLVTDAYLILALVTLAVLLLLARARERRGEPQRAGGVVAEDASPDRAPRAGSR